MRGEGESRSELPLPSVGERTLVFPELCWNGLWGPVVVKHSSGRKSLGYRVVTAACLEGGLCPGSLAPNLKPLGCENS